MSIAKNAYKKIGALINSMKFLSSEVAFVPINLPYALAWKISCLGWCSSMLDEYLGLLVLHLLPLLKP